VTHRSRDRLVAGVVALLLLGGLAALSIAAISPPAAVGADAPPEQFSADRAYQHLQSIGSQVHPAGSVGAGEVRDYIMSTLTTIGLQPRIQQAVGADGALSGPYGMARVHNVVALLPGTAPTGRVVMFAHYDSVQVSFGGNDDGAGVSTLLETARAVLAGPRPTNDIVFLFTDAEEACLCGAEAFVGQDPLARGGGVALNFESRGTTGPAIMFETSRGNAAIVDVYGSAVPHPVATSFAAEVYRILPNDTDFSPFRESGSFTGLNTAYIDGSAVYHTPEDKPSTMDLASLQQHGDNAVALARAFGSADIAGLARPDASDDTYFPALGALARYPGTLVWPLAVLGVLAALALTFLARRCGLVSWPRAAAGLGLAVVPFVLAPVGAQLLWLGLVALRPGYANMIDPWWPGWYRACVVALVAAILLTWYAVLRRRVGPWPLVIGALGLLGVLGVLLAAAAPGGSYLASLPALAGALGGMVAVAAHSWLVRLIAVTLAGAVAVVVLAPTVSMFFPALGLATGAAAALFAVMLGLALLPVIDWVYPVAAGQGEASGGGSEDAAAQQVPPRSRHRLWAAVPALIAGGLTVVFLAAGLTVDHFDATHPAPAQLAYALDADTGQARWISTDPSPGEWVRRYVSEQQDLSAPFGLFDGRVWTGEAPPAALPAPRLTVLSDSSTGTRRTLTVTLTPQRAVRLVYLDVPESTVRRAFVDGREVPAEGLTGLFGVVFHAPPADGLTVVLELASPGPVTIRVLDGSDGLDTLQGFVPRPDGVGVAPSHTSELVVVGKSYTV
jgi:Peptidase family M28